MSMSSISHSSNPAGVPSQVSVASGVYSPEAKGSSMFTTPSMKRLSQVTVKPQALQTPKFGAGASGMMTIPRADEFVKQLPLEAQLRPVEVTPSKTTGGNDAPTSSTPDLPERAYQKDKGWTSIDQKTPLKLPDPFVTQDSMNRLRLNAPLLGEQQGKQALQTEGSKPSPFVSLPPKATYKSEHGLKENTSKMGAFLKGVVSPVTGLFSVQGLAGMAAVGAATSVVGAAALAPWLLGAGALYTGVTALSGLKKTTAGRTDLEQADGFYELGSALSSGVGTLLGANPAGKAIGAKGMSQASLKQNPLQYLKNSPKDFLKTLHPETLAKSIQLGKSNALGFGNRIKSGILLPSGSYQHHWSQEEKASFVGKTQEALKTMPKLKPWTQHIPGSKPALPSEQRFQGVYATMDKVNAYYRSLGKKTPTASQAMPPQSTIATTKPQPVTAQARANKAELQVPKLSAQEKPLFPKTVQRGTLAEMESLAHVQRLDQNRVLYTTVDPQDLQAFQGKALRDAGFKELYTSPDEALRVSRALGHTQGNKVMAVELPQGTSLMTPATVGGDAARFYLPRNTVLQRMNGGLLYGDRLQVAMPEMYARLQNLQYYMTHRNHYNPLIRQWQTQSPATYQRLMNDPTLLSDLHRVGTSDRVDTLKALSKLLAEQPEVYTALRQRPGTLDGLMTQVEMFRRHPDGATAQSLQLQAPTRAFRGVMNGVDHQQLVLGQTYSDPAPIRVAEKRGLAKLFAGDPKKDGLMIEFRDKKGLPVVDKQLMQQVLPAEAANMMDEQLLLAPSTRFKLTERRLDGSYLAEVVPGTGASASLPIDPKHHAKNVALAEARKSLYLSPERLSKDFVSSVTMGGLMAMPTLGPLAPAAIAMAYPVTKPMSLLAGHAGYQVAKATKPEWAPQITGATSMVAGWADPTQELALSFIKPAPPPKWYQALNPFYKHQGWFTVKSS
ncbi:MAG: hypothetical protein ACKO37_00365 [Vampirovibrionales bacterium]